MTRLVKDLRRVIPLEERVDFLLPPRSMDAGFPRADRAYILAGCDS